MNVWNRMRLERVRYNLLRRQQKLQTKAAILGISTPPEIEIEIEDIGTELERINEVLQGLVTSDGQNQNALDDVKNRIDSIEKNIQEYIEERTLILPLG